MNTRNSASSRGRAFTWHDLVAVLVLCVLSVALYRKIALTNRIMSGTDAMTYFYPYRAYAAQAIRAGRVPLWNPYLFLGVPFLANPQTAVFYPLNLVLSGLTAPKQVAWSLVIHTALASIFAYLYARRVLLLSPWAACLAAAAFGHGGYLTAQAEHVNQVNVLAWFPLLLLLWEVRRRAQWLALSGLAAVIGVGLLAGHTQASFVSLVGLALYAAVTGLFFTSRGTPGIRSGRSVLSGWPKSLFATGWQLALVALAGFGLAAVQVLPTIELSQLSIRGGGLDYRQAVAFSLKPLPRLLRYTFLPRLWGQGADLEVLFGGSYYTEYLAYIGVVALVLALLACGVWFGAVAQVRRVEKEARPSRFLGYIWLHESKATLPLVALGVAGLLLALGLYNPLYWLLYRLVPGFGLFRAPTRWLFLYAFSSAMLAGIGLQHVQKHVQNMLSSHPPQTHSVNRRPTRLARLVFSLRSLLTKRAWLVSILPKLLTLIVLAELLIAARYLPLNRPTAPESFLSLRTAPAHIGAAQAQEAAPGRFLSMSDTLFDPGDLAEIEQIYQGQLAPLELYRHIVNVKRQEIMAPNLPLAWHTYAVDGYDGGVLPLTRYVQLQRLLLDEKDILRDGRIREGLESIPSSRVLSLLGAEYIITDKTHDVWIDDVFYDLAFETTLTGDAGSAKETQRIVRATPSLGALGSTATTLGIVSHLQDAQQVSQGDPVVRVVLTMRKDGAPGILEHRTFELLAGRDTAEGLYSQAAAHSQARIGRQWQAKTGTEVQTGYDYVTELSWEDAREIVSIALTALPFEGQLSIRGLSLIDRRDQSSEPLLLDSRGRFRQVHSGDVKIYQALDALPRAYVVHQSRILEDDTRAIPAMADPTFDPSQLVLLHPDPQHRKSQPAPPQRDNSSLPPSHVAVVAYKPEEIILQADMKQPGYVVLSDTWYPGWQALLDGQPTRIERANLVFRAIHVPQGRHSLQLRYRPASYLWGLRLSLGALSILGLGSLLCVRKAGRASCRRDLAGYRERLMLGT